HDRTHARPGSARPPKSPGPAAVIPRGSPARRRPVRGPQSSAKLKAKDDGHRARSTLPTPADAGVVPARFQEQWTFATRTVFATRSTVLGLLRQPSRIA